MAKINLSPHEVNEFANQLKLLKGLFDRVMFDYTRMQQYIDAKSNQVAEANNRVLCVRKVRLEQALERHQSALARSYDLSNEQEFQFLTLLQAEVRHAKTLYDESHQMARKIDLLQENVESRLRKNSERISRNILTLVEEIDRAAIHLEQFVEYVRQSEVALQESGDNPGQGNVTSSPLQLQQKVGFKQAVTAGSAVGGLFAGKVWSQMRISGKDLLPSQSVWCYKNYPQRNTIKGLEHTAQSWHRLDENTEVFDSPEQTGELLDSQQGKMRVCLGTCGCVSCVNVIRMAGHRVTEQDLVSFAAVYTDESGHSLCTIGSPYPEENGGTNYIERQKILSAYGIESTLEESTIENIFRFVSDGRGVIASVHAGVLYYGRVQQSDYHAVTITSVKLKNGKPFSVIVCDSNGMPSQEYPVDIFEAALTKKALNVTKEIIR